MKFQEGYRYGVEGKINEIKTVVKGGETYFYLFINGVSAKMATDEDNYGMLFPEEPTDSNKHCFELSFKENPAAILLKAGDSVHLEAPEKTNYIIPSLVKVVNGLVVS